MNPAYTGKAQALAAPGSAEGGTMEYSLDGETWSKAVPTATEPGAVKVSWKKTPKANAGYEIVVRYSKNGKAVATKTVKAGKKSATVKGLTPGKRAYVEVHPMRKAGGSTYDGTFMRAKSPVKVSGSSGAKPQSSGALTAAAI